MDENFEGEELDNIVILNDENGNEVKFEFLDIVELYWVFFKFNILNLLFEFG